MSWLDGLRHRIRTVLDPGGYDRDMDDEIRHHVELGGTRRFGNRTYHKEEARRMTWLGSLDVFVQEARHSWRSLLRNPGFAVTVVATLALGLGANGALFSFLDRVFLRTPDGIAAGGSLRRVWIDHSAGWGQRQMSPGVGYPTLLALRAAAEGRAPIALYSANNHYLGRDHSQPVHGAYVTANYFEVLGVRPALGRFIATDEDVMGRGTQVAVLSYAFWHRRFDRDSAILGRPISIGLRAFTVVGIAAEGFRGLDAQTVDVWIPLATLVGRRQRDREWWQTGTTYGARAIMRMPDGFDANRFLAQATVGMRRAEYEEDPRYGDSLIAPQLGSIIEARGPGNLGREFMIATRLGGVAIIVLLIALANVVNLLLARTLDRQREIAIRLALGVSRTRLVRLLTTETLILSLLAGGVALLVSLWGGRILRALLLPNVKWYDSPVDLRVVLFTLAVAVAAGVIAGVIPAIQATGVRVTGLNAPAAGASRGARITQRTFVAAQAAFSVVLVVAGTLFVRSLNNVLDVPLGLDSDQLVFAQVSFEPGEAPADSAQAQVMREVAREVTGDRRIESVARAGWSPMRGFSYMGHYLESDTSKSFGQYAASNTVVSKTFFDAAGLRLIRGTTFSGDDESVAQNEIVVNTTMARRYWPGQDPIGQCLRIGKPSSPCFRVVGLAEQAPRFNVIEEASAQFYGPLGNNAFSTQGLALVVRTAPGAREAVASMLETRLKQRFPLGYPFVKRMTENLEAEYRPWRVAARLFGAFSILALLVAIVGIYGAVAYAVNRRTKEFGVRIALGARVRDVLSQVVGEGLGVVAIGVAVGVALSLAGGRLLASMLFGVEPNDLSALLLSSCSMLLVAGMSAALPAWRVSRVDPVTALRSD